MLWQKTLGTGYDQDQEGNTDRFWIIPHTNEGRDSKCGSPPGVMMADTLSFNAKIGVVDF